jgi:hypothetical protein
MLAQILGFQANGQGVTVTPSNAMLTTHGQTNFAAVSQGTKNPAHKEPGGIWQRV